MDDGELLCHACVLHPHNPVRDERANFEQAPTFDAFVRDGWGVIAFDHTGNLDEPEHCAHCNKEIH
jgi:hypothetical protein